MIQNKSKWIKVTTFLTGFEMIYLHPWYLLTIWLCFVILYNTPVYSQSCQNHVFAIHKSDVLLLYRTYIFSCDQAALRMVQSVCSSVRHFFLTMFPSSYHHEIFRSYYQWQKPRPYKRSRSEVKGQGHRGKKNIVKFDPDWAFPDCNSSLNSPMATKWCTKLEEA